MNFRKGTRYALYAAMEMARSEEGRPVTAAQVAAVYGIATAVLSKVFQQLVRAGLAAGTRGVKGGYVLTKPPARLTVLDVIEVFEPPRRPDGCLLADHDEPDCAKADACRLRRLLDEVEETARCTYASVTLDTLVGARGRTDEALPVIS
ncbi:MAG: Rrf2 family transcriptional regulator [Acidobacteria bacterium]|nr:Rrf2 family transcriptional regulator [Acidobacteriota bacterium]NIM62753.1 Rrf2 family transcriptional regulator [Acidobacteriota bacterium]NIO59053.1 Rrf2 family transcriptional regulator [Acidobacteriota bacterium]NIQ30092.1 Rrf2 family transcriptional regulator [Acidobacteriota bacterium]NIQ84895.1 Rrf2 family transcriptional regulator [Acidobacteriota bacterium]